MKNHPEAHSSDLNSKLNSLRAAVLGANDGIVSIAGIIMGVAGASAARSTILTAGIAGLTAGALAMAAGEFVSVSSQRDTEKALLAKEKAELASNQDFELRELEALYEAKGLKKSTARLVARELTANDVYAAHVDAELGINPNELTNPWHAAVASAMAFIAGAMIPVLAVLIAPAKQRILVIIIAVVLALAITGNLSARFSGASAKRTVFRVVIGGMLAMGVTFLIGKLFGGVVV